MASSGRLFRRIIRRINRNVEKRDLIIIAISVTLSFILVSIMGGFQNNPFNRKNPFGIQGTAIKSAVKIFESLGSMDEAQKQELKEVLKKIGAI